MLGYARCQEPGMPASDANLANEMRCEWTSSDRATSAIVEKRMAIVVMSLGLRFWGRRMKWIIVGTRSTAPPCRHTGRCLLSNFSAGVFWSTVSSCWLAGCACAFRPHVFTLSHCSAHSVFVFVVIIFIIFYCAGWRSVGLSFRWNLVAL